MALKKYKVLWGTVSSVSQGGFIELEQKHGERLVKIGAVTAAGKTVFIPDEVEQDTSQPELIPELIDDTPETPEPIAKPRGRPKAS